MEERDTPNIYTVPANYTDSGKLFGGMVETRNAVEAGLLVAAAGFPELSAAMPFRIRVAVMAATLIPLAVLALAGIGGDSLTQCAWHVARYAARRRKIHFRRVGYRHAKAGAGQGKKKGRRPRQGRGVRAGLPAGA